MPNVTCRAGSGGRWVNAGEDSSSPASVPNNLSSPLNGFEFLRQCGADRDGISYQAKRRADGKLVEIRVLTCATAQASRWRELCKRLRQISLASSDGTLRIVQLQLSEEPMFVALEWFDGETLAVDPPPLRGSGDILELSRQLADSLAESHKLGFAHGCVHANHIRWKDGRAKLDFAHVLTTGGPWAGSKHSVRGSDAAIETDPAGDDVYGLGNVLAGLCGTQVAHLTCFQDDHEAAAKWKAFVEGMLAPSERRLTMPEVVSRLEEIHQPGHGNANLSTDHRESSDRTTSQVAAGTEGGTSCEAGETNDFRKPTPEHPLPVGFRLGRLRLLERLGQGGSATVYRAEDSADQTIVAAKIFHPGTAENLARFRKEARLLAEIDNPYAARLIGFHQDGEVHYLVMEYVEGTNLAELIEESCAFTERDALSIMADVCRGLQAAHQRGIVHRDVKPANILVQRPEVSSPTSPDIDPETRRLDWRARLVDFGVARRAEDPELTGVTQHGALVGTPLYMSPEQCSQGRIESATDIYAVGATLFHLLTGRPPFVGQDTWSLVAQHMHDPPPRMDSLRADLSEGVCRLVARSLSKTPAGRSADASEMLIALEALLRGEPSEFEAHPRLPDADPDRVLQYDFSWRLQGSPSQLWPYVSNTERLNQALGLQAVDFRSEATPEGPARFAEVRVFGVKVEWREHPFEWIEGRRFSVLREFIHGPFKWLTSTVTFAALENGGTQLTHCLLIEPRSVLGRLAASVEIGVKARRGLDRVYRHIDETVAGGTSPPLDAFQPPRRLRSSRRRRLVAFLDQLEQQGNDPAIVRRLGEFLADSAEQDLARIRPLEFADRFDLNRVEVANTCLQAARVGLLVLMWDILCPICRIPSAVADTLEEIHDHASCPACNLDFETNFADSVEMIFRPSAMVRKVDVKTYCIGGPAHSPHVAVQSRLAAHEQLRLDLSLHDGQYHLAGRQLSEPIGFEVRASGKADHWEVMLRKNANDRAPCLASGRQRLILTNQLPEEVVVRIERLAASGDALTAARATAMPAFRKLFPAELLAARQLMSVGVMTFLAFQLADAERRPTTATGPAADAEFSLPQKLLAARAAADCIESNQGAVFRTGIIDFAVFDEPQNAVNAAREIRDSTAAERTADHRVAIHTGPAMAATVHDQLDYFGPTLQALTDLLQLGEPGELLISDTVAGDPAVHALLDEAQLVGPIESWNIADRRGGRIHRLRL